MRKITSLALVAAMVPALAVGTVAAGEWDQNMNLFAQAETETEAVPPGDGEQDQQQIDQQDQQQQDQQQQEQQEQQQQESTDIQVDQQAPEVTIDQPAPEVHIEQPEPEVQIEQPEPDVQIDQAEPDVQIEQSEPDVQIQEQSEPEVQIQDQGDQNGQQDDQLEQDMQQQDTQQQTTGLMSMRAGDLEGVTVLNQDGQEIGDVQYIAVEQASGNLYAVLTVGGFWGIGGSDIAMPLDEMDIQNNQLLLATNRTEDQLEDDADGFDQAQFVQLDSDMTLSEAAQQQ